MEAILSGRLFEDAILYTVFELLKRSGPDRGSITLDRELPGRLRIR
jgi:hypothetical protein